ncbi:acyl-CoA thioesterase [Pseudomonas sp. SWI6]|uniref:Acyl-CoA thioesterase n=1 Tax=Pseudomonas taiwanensis TaxID=470150 RepID=A0ABR6V9F2_9PSED|nr:MULTISPECIES: thioesterase family protein [Pseudomonas]AGZ37638.1 thioesterase superfamily protein [Pseudomonas sp. VLB120]AVD81077.1 acyl-CoA thioesterase [Pseudomonas sp. SWI6]AVD88008.1 acyl-CoA thioesterase [Pseudomonas sp. SWI44]MBC3477087.1 acyl-CoA thioesterase [Pseudomonas taiwanensis]MBC3489848.1 acyl-CoA thioesterase [Pseudomonas taiwanensis]
MTESPNRTAFSHFHPILTRPQDNDHNGHVAGATVHGFFETAIQAFLVEQADMDLRDGELAAFVVSSSADFYALPGFPDVLEVGLGITRLAGSTVEYRLALFRPGDQDACAAGRVVQVFIERESGRPVPLPSALSSILSGLQLDPQT